jgi:hypothetical protein
VALSWLIVFLAVGTQSAGEERGTAGALLGMSSGVASAAGLAIAPLFSFEGAAHAAFVFAGVLVAAQVALLVPACAAMPTESRHETLPRPLPEARRQSHLGLALVLFGHFALVSAAVAVLIPYLLRTLGLPLAEAVVLLAPAAGAAVLAMLLTGRMSAAGSRFRIAPVLYGAAGVSLLVLAATDAVPLAVVVMVPLAAGLAAATPLVNASVLDVTEERSGSGRALGWFFFAEGAGAVAGPGLVAAGIDAWGVDAGLAISGLGLAVLAGLIALPIRRSWR